MHYKDSIMGFGTKLRDRPSSPPDPFSHPIGFTAKLSKTFPGQIDEPPSIGFLATLRTKPPQETHPQLSFDFNAPLLERASSNAVMANQRAQRAKTPEKMCP
ncbi:MAG: hypothetical protein ACXW30_00375 [Micavibrio sp.]